MVLLQACQALRAVHASGAFHRDIKPDNMLLSEDGNMLLNNFDAACLETDPPAYKSTDAGTATLRSPCLDCAGLRTFEALDDWASLGLSIASLVGLYNLGSCKKYGALKELARVPWIPEWFQQQLNEVVRQ